MQNQIVAFLALAVIIDACPSSCGALNCDSSFRVACEKNNTCTWCACTSIDCMHINETDICTTKTAAPSLPSSLFKCDGMQPKRQQATNGFRFLSKDSLWKGKSDLPERIVKMPLDLPASFDAREQWPHCPSIGEIYDQAACGSCWAVATVTAATDRLCIATGVNTRLSVEHMLGCCHVCGFGCGEGFYNYAWQWLAGQKGTPYGLVSGGQYNTSNFCSAYSLPPCNHYDSPNDPLPSCEKGIPDKTPQCPTTCDSKSSYRIPFNKDIHQFETAYSIPSDEERIMAEIYTNGPVTTGFNVYSDWVHYRSGVYQTTGGEDLGGHAVRIIGWGIEDEKKYWLVANSFGVEWGDKGFFKILRGVGECGIERQVVAGLYRKPISDKSTVDIY